MSVKSIHFPPPTSDDMVRALLADRKTVTRRVMKPQPKYCKMSMAGLVVSKKPIQIIDGLIDASNALIMKPPYHPGDILYVRETWAKYLTLDSAETVWLYKADNPAKRIYDDNEILCDDQRIEWRLSIHMPREAARIFLRVTDMWVERLQDSFFKHGSVIFCLQKEGVDIGGQCRQCIAAYGSPCCIDDESECGVLDDVRSEFSDLWNSTIKPADRALYGWDANPWAWVIEFERCEKPEDG